MTVEKDQYAQDIGSFHRWAKSNNLLAGRDSQPNSTTISFIVTVRSDLVQSLEARHKQEQGGKASSQAPAAKAPTWTWARHSNHKYVSSIPIPKAIAPISPFERIAPIIVCEWIPSWNDEGDAIDWELLPGQGKLWLDTKQLGTGQTKICCEVCCSAPPIIWLSLMPCISTNCQARYADPDSSRGQQPPNMPLVAKEIKYSILEDSRQSGMSTLQAYFSEVEAHMWGLAWTKEFTRALGDTPSSEWAAREL